MLPIHCAKKPYEKLADGTIQEVEVPYDIPDSWEWVRLGNIISAKGGKRIPKGYNLQEEDNGHPYLRVTDMKNGTIVPNSIKYAPDTVYEKIKNYTISSNDIYITIAGTIGDIGVVPKKFNNALLTENALKLMLTSSVNKMFLVYLLNSQLVQQQFKVVYNQVAQPKLSIRSTNSTLIPLPPLSEQKRIVEQIERALEKVESYSESYNKLQELDKTFPDKLKKSILQYAMQGKLVPQDPNDEPVEVLLEKIKAEKQKLYEEGKLKKKDLGELVLTKGDDNSPYKEVPYSIPESWTWVKLGDIGLWGAGATPSKSNIKYYEPQSIPWLLTGDLNDGYITNIPNKISELALEKTSVKLNPKGTVLIAMYGATIGKLGILTFPATTNQACCACNTLFEADKLFLFYFLMSERKKFTSRAEGGAQPNISKEKIVNTLFPLPPLAEQQRIVSKISQVFSVIESLV